jgi:Ni,Fe-hydrogenase III large subunit
MELELQQARVGETWDGVGDILAPARWLERDLLRPPPPRSEVPQPLQDVRGSGVFTVPFGPVRSGVVESMLYDVATAGEDMLRVAPRLGFKRRGLERQATMRPLNQLPLLAERMAGMFSVAGAMAMCHAVETAAGVTPSAEANAIRALLAELERVFNHLDQIMKLCEDASLVVGVAQMGILKERVLRLIAALTGHRYGRGVVTLGGVQRGLNTEQLQSTLDLLNREGRRVRRLLLSTTSFRDRLERTGALSPEDAAALGAAGPLARASDLPWDARVERPYGAYVDHPVTPARMVDGDVMARFEVRLFEIRESLRLVAELANSHDLAAPPASPPAVVLEAGAIGVGWAEAPEGEWLVVIEADGDGGRLARCRVRPASLMNFACFGRACEGWVLTDFAFIEHSFGLSVAGYDR